MHFACSLHPVILGLLPSLVTHMHTCTGTHTHTLIKTLISSACQSCIRHSAAVLVQAGLGTLTDQEDSIHYDAHIIKASKHMNYSRQQTCLSSMSLSLYVCL